MSPCPKNLIDSNNTGLYIAEEECPGELPTTPVWYAQEPNSYSDFGGDVETVQREFIDPSRQNQKGTPTNRNASGGFSTDMTRSNLTRLLQGFFFADARQALSSSPINDEHLPIYSALFGSGHAYTTDNDLRLADANVDDLLFAQGFEVPTNNGLKLVDTSSTVGTLSRIGTVTGDHNAELTPPVDAKLDVVGRQFAASDLSLSYVSGLLSIVSAAYDFTTNADLHEGQVIFIGGDEATERFDNNVGFARIKHINADSLVFSDSSWTPVTESGTGKTIRIFIPITVKNENTPALIKKRTYQLERTLGLSEEELMQAEYLEGCIANELTITIPTADKITADLGYVAIVDSEKTGLGTDLRKTGDYVDSPKQNALNTSTDVYGMKLKLLTEDSSTHKDLFAYVTDASFTINNNATSNQAVGILGALENTVGTFNVSGSITAYFTSLAAKRAMRTLQDVSMTFYVARDNAGIVLDIPLVSLSGGKVSVDKDAPVTIPIEAMGSENELGYTASYSEFVYLPDIAMPTV